MLGKPRRISTLLLGVLATISMLVLAGFVVLLVGMFEIRKDLAGLRSRTAPRLVKLSQLSQEASATIAIAPALSARPARFEFETLLSRIQDKEISQRELIAELQDLYVDEDAARVLQTNGDLLMDNLRDLTDTVRDQIETRRVVENQVEEFRRQAGKLSREVATNPKIHPVVIYEQAGMVVHKVLAALLDPSSARFPRNRKEIDSAFTQLQDEQEIALESGIEPAALDPVARFADYWEQNQDSIYRHKQSELSSEFRIKALVEENSLIANRLLASANNEFSRAGAEVDAQLELVRSVSNFTLIAIVVLIVAFAAGNVYVWVLLRRRVFERLDNMRSAIQSFAENRDRSEADDIADEIGEISTSLVRYMGEIERREVELRQLSSQLAKYLSPQVYDSIFRGEQEVKVASSRKKLTVFFSDIAGFTEEADRLQSEELTALINHYLTEMSRIALQHGATIDKYVGDAIMIFFGDPETRGSKEDALSCVNMAIAMRKRMNDLKDIWRESGIERPLQIRMGIHTDYCTVGNFGSEDRMDYTIIGGAVNIASRLETLAEPGDILISYETFSQVKDVIHCEEHGQFEVKGIPYPVATFRVTDSYRNLGRERCRFAEDHPGFSVNIDLESMTSSDRQQARDCLQRAIDTISEEPDRES